jgi:hypothetical protein
MLGEQGTTGPLLNKDESKNIMSQDDPKNGIVEEKIGSGIQQKMKDDISEGPIAGDSGGSQGQRDSNN